MMRFGMGAALPSSNIPTFQHSSIPPVTPFVCSRSACGRLAASVCAAASWWAGPAEAAPRIATPQATHAFGWRDAAETVTNRFTLRNTGDAPLFLTDIRLSCGCSRAEPGRRALAPGEDTALEVQTALRGLHGPLRKSVTVSSNDPDTPYLTLWITGEARSAVCLEPPSVSFGRVHPREPPAPVAVRLSGYLTNVTITAATSDNPAYTLTRSPDGRSLTVSPPQFASPGACRSMAHVTLSEPGLPTLALPLYAWQDDLLRIAPSALAFRPSSEAASTRLVIVRPGTAKRFKITGVTIEGGAGLAKIISRPDGNFQIVVDGVVPDSLSSNAALVVRTDLTARPDWRVPLRLEGSRAP